MSSSGSSETSVGIQSHTDSSSTCASTATSTTSTNAASLSSTSTYVESKTNLIINYLPSTLTHEEFKQLFMTYGELESCRLVCDKQTSQSLCYGFVNYVREESALMAHKSANGLKIKNKIIKVSFARPSCESIKGANLYVCGIPKIWTEIELNAYFSQCGHIITSRILLNPSNGTSKGDGFIRFNTREEALCAISKLNGTQPTIESKDCLTVKMANYNDPKTYAANQLMQQQQQQQQQQQAQMIQHRVTQTMPILKRQLSNLNVYQAQKPLDLSQQQITQPILDFSFAPLVDASTHTQRLFTTTTSTTTSPSTQVASSTSTIPNLGWCLFVYNLPPETDEGLLWQMFGPFGAILNIKVIRDMKTKQCKGFSFVTMTNYDEAILAITALHGFTLGNRILQVSFKTNPIFF